MSFIRHFAIGLVFLSAAFSADGGSESLQTLAPVWVDEAATGSGVTVSFRSTFDWVDGGEAPELQIAASAVYRAFLNGEFVGWGPARTVIGFARVDKWALNPLKGRNVLTIEVAGYRFESYQYNGGEPFLSACVVAGGRTLVSAPTDFEAVEVRRTKTGPKYSRQRGFVAEAYEVDGEDIAWRKGEAVSRPRLKLVSTACPKALPREVPYPDFTIRSDFVSATDAAGNGILRLNAVDTGFVGLDVVCTQPGRIAFEFDEALGTNGVIDLSRNGDPLSSWHAMYNRLVWDVKEPGAYSMETIEPYTLKFAQVKVEGGAFASVRPYLRRCRNPLVSRSFYRSGDPRLNALFAAAQESLAQNAVDILTDCPSRERVGWLCDTFFSSEASAWLTGDFAIEREYLLNFARTDDYGKNVPAGAIPGFMPSRRGGVMPTYMMWYALQCCAAAERLSLSDRTAFLSVVGPRISGVFGWLEGFVKEGLLENLPGWVFVEWSKANDYVKGVNYPANMLWALALERSGRLLGRQDWVARARSVRAAVRRQSFDGRFFHDQAQRGADGRLVRTEEAKTESCQYYAFFTGLATKATDPALWRTLVDELGPNRRGHDDMVASDAFIGWLLRLTLLARAGENARLLADMKTYYGGMARESGTFWEFADGHDSRCHAIGSYVAVLMLREALGIGRIDWAAKKLHVTGRPSVAPDVVCAFPTADGPISFVDGKVTLPPGWTIGRESD